MIKPVFRKWYILTSLFLVGSCGPSIEEKARQVALRDSFSIDSALKKEASVKRIFLHRAKLRNDSVLKAAHERLRRQADSASMHDSLNPALPHTEFPSDSLHRHPKRDTLKRHSPLIFHSRSGTDSLQRKHRKTPLRIKDSSAD